MIVLGELEISSPDICLGGFSWNSEHNIRIINLIAASSACICMISHHPSALISPSPTRSRCHSDHLDYLMSTSSCCHHRSQFSPSSRSIYLTVSISSQQLDQQPRVCKPTSTLISSSLAPLKETK